MTLMTTRARPIRMLRPIAAAAAIAVFGGCGASAEVQLSDEAVAPAPTGNSLFGSYLAARFASSELDRDKAAEFFEDALELDPGNRMLLEGAMVYSASAADIEGALELAPRVVKVEEGNAVANLLLGVEALRTGRYDRALEHFKTEGDESLADWITALLGMWAHQAAGEPEAARAVLDGLKGGKALDAFKSFHAGLLAELQGRPDDAEAAFREARETSQSISTVDAYGRLLERRGKRQEAIDLYRSFLETSPDFPIITRSLARAEAGGPVEPFLADAIDGAAETLYSMGAVLTREGGDNDALIYLNLALHLRPDYDLARFLVADLHDRQQRYEEAIEAYSAIPDDSPLKREAEIEAAVALDRLDRTEQAKSRLDALIAADPTDSVALVSAGSMLRARERFAEAAVYYSRAIDLIAEPSQSDWQLYYYRGICYERTDEWPKAEADLKKALDLQPEQALVLNYLGYSWIDLGLNLVEALRMVEKAVEQRPEDGYIVDSLGWAYYRLGDFERAVEELERAVELRPDDPVINDHLGDAYWQVGRTLEARFQWNHALAMEPEEEEVAKIESKLEVGIPKIPPNTRPAADAGSAGRPGADKTKSD